MPEKKVDKNEIDDYFKEINEIKGTPEWLKDLIDIDKDVSADFYIGRKFEDTVNMKFTEFDKKGFVGEEGKYIVHAGIFIPEWIDDAINLCMRRRFKKDDNSYRLMSRRLVTSNMVKHGAKFIPELNLVFIDMINLMNTIHGMCQSEDIPMPSNIFNNIRVYTRKGKLKESYVNYLWWCAGLISKASKSYRGKSGSWNQSDIITYMLCGAIADSEYVFPQPYKLKAINLMNNIKNEVDRLSSSIYTTYIGSIYSNTGILHDLSLKDFKIISNEAKIINKKYKNEDLMNKFTEILTELKEQEDEDENV